MRAEPLQATVVVEQMAAGQPQEPRLRRLGLPVRRQATEADGAQLLRVGRLRPAVRERGQRHRALPALAAVPARRVPVETAPARARPASGSRNLVLPKSVRKKASLPPVGKSESPRAGSEAGYAAVAAQYPDNVFVVSCDLDPSTKLAKARGFLAADHQFEMSIEEQAACLLTDGLALAGPGPQLNVVSTFAAFYEGIAREGFDMWRYQRNLTGVNEGINAAFHVSHVGACTGRDHFSGWGLEWINVGISYLPYLHRFYGPADARAAYLAVCDMAAHYGGHIIGIPRDSLPILEKQDGSGPLWEAGDDWEPATCAAKARFAATSTKTGSCCSRTCASLSCTWPKRSRCARSTKIVLRARAGHSAGAGRWATRRKRV